MALIAADGAQVPARISAAPIAFDGQPVSRWW